jgi:hypothetical protein
MPSLFPADSATHCCRIFIHKTLGTAPFPAITMTLQNGGGTVRLIVNVSTGAVVIETGAGNAESNSAGDWWEVLIDVQNAGSAVQGFLEIFPAFSTDGTSQDVTATGTAVIGNAEFHLNKTIAQVRGSTPIFTSGSTVTVDASDPSFDDANHADLEGAYFCEFKNVGLDAANKGGLVGLGTSGRLFFTSIATDIRCFDGTNQPTGPAITLAADDTEYKIGLAYGDASLRVNTDDVWGTAGSYDGAFDNGNSKLDVLHGTTFLTDPSSVMLLRNLRRYDLPYLEAQDRIDELMA